MVDGKKLKKIVIQIFRKRGLSLSHASISAEALINAEYVGCLLYTSPSPRDRTRSRMPSSA